MGHVVDCRPTHYHHIDRWQFILCRAETFPHQTLDTIPDYRLFDAFFGNRKPETRMSILTRSRQDRERVVAATDRLLEYTTVFPGVSEAPPTAETSSEVDVREYRSFSGCLMKQIQGQSFALPLARRRFITRRPPLVRMRTRNPCVRLRRNLLG